MGAPSAQLPVGRSAVGSRHATAPRTGVGRRAESSATRAVGRAVRRRQGPGVGDAELFIHYAGLLVSARAGPSAATTGRASQASASYSGSTARLRFDEERQGVAGLFVTPRGRRTGARLPSRRACCRGAAAARASGTSAGEGCRCPRGVGRARVDDRDPRDRALPRALGRAGRCIADQRGREARGGNRV